MRERVAGCRLLAEVGSGGMAVVYRAEQEALGRLVAVKALKRAAAEEETFRERFSREARSVAALSHENIVQVFDFVKEGDEDFIVMEFVDGVDLFDLLERAGRLPPLVAAVVGLQIARALGHAHYAGIVHRDVKPANVMVGRSGLVKLMDFGIARDDSLVDLTRDGSGLGTPSYMSPEQVQGERIDFRADLFSFGIVLYQMLVGQKPFVDDSRATVLERIRTEEPVPPRRRDPRIPRDLERIVLRCLEKRREDRYRATHDLVAEMEAFLAEHAPGDHRARLVAFLVEQKVVERGEAKRFLHPAVADVGAGAAGPSRQKALRRLVAWQAGITLAMGVAGAAVIAGTAGGAGASPAEAVVVVPPGGAVFVDGERVPAAARSLELRGGLHAVEVRAGGPVERALERRELTVPSGGMRILRLSPRR